MSSEMSETMRSSLRIGDPVRLKDSDVDLRGDVWVPYREADRAARLQFRSQAQLEALKRGTTPALAGSR